MAPMPPDTPPAAVSSPAAAARTSSRPRPSPITSSDRHLSDPRWDAFPFTFNRPSRAKPSSTSLVSSTALGKPVPLDNSTAEHRTSALREINHHYPSRHRHAKSVQAQNTTYSEPVIVRSYRPPLPGHRQRSATGATRAVCTGSGCGPGSDACGSGTVLARGLPFASKVGIVGNGKLGAMARVDASKASAAPAQDEARLPPVEAFSFKSFMANVEAQDGGTDLNADLDRIAEICARSRYSLSNQYEVHYNPHGSGASFVAVAHKSPQVPAPPLQAVSSDDERRMGRHRRTRRPAGRRRSQAIGTLETIMSSRSSDEDTTKKKPAAEIAQEIRGRASRTESGGSLPSSASSRGALEGGAVHLQDDEVPPKAHARRSSTSLCLIDGSRQKPTAPDDPGSRLSAIGLVSEPALPQASTSQLELRTGPEARRQSRGASGHIKTTAATPLGRAGQPAAKGSIAPIQETGSSGAGLLAAFGGWIPWGSPGRQEGRAEGSLRHLLKAADCSRGKGVAKMTS